MLTLYYKPTCPFCQKVLAVVEEMGLQPELKDISADQTFADELVERGGKRQVPYLVDSERDVEMYESDDIIAHFRAHYAGGADSSLHVEKDPDCESCQ